jgi:hypothetical protein
MEAAMSNEQNQEPFAKEKSPTKTYSLVELVKAPTTMADHGPDDSIFSFPAVALLELLPLIGSMVLLMFIIIWMEQLIMRSYVPEWKQSDF